MSVETRAYDRSDGTPVAVLVATGTYDVARLVGLLAKGVYEHSKASRKLRQQVKRHNGGQAALRLLRDNGGPDFTDGRLTDDEIAPLSVEERLALPVPHHEPVFSAPLGVWFCRVCWDRTWPCAPAHRGGRVLAERLGLQVVT